MNIGDKVFLTKYALSNGIEYCEVSRFDGDDLIQLDGFFGWFSAKSEVFTTLTEALANCEKRRAKAIAASEKKIAKLRAMKFELKFE